MSPLDSLGRPRTVLLLGATSDIGRAIVTRMVEDGTRRIILAGRDPGASDASISGATTEQLYFDATDTASHPKFFEEVFSDHPGIDVVVVAFGVMHDQADVETSPELGVEMAHVNYAGAASTLLHSAGRLRAGGGGRLVVLSSVAGVTPRRSNFMYGSSKAGIDFMARGLASSLETSDVDVLIVRPGFVHTSMTEGMKPRPFSVSADTVADAVVDALARQARVIWVPSILKWVMLVLRLLPSRVVDRLEG